MPPADTHSNILLSFILLLVISGLTAYYAERKGRSAAAWFVIGLLISFFAPLVLFFMPSLKDQSNETLPLSSRNQIAPPPVPARKVMNEDKLWYYLDLNHEQYGPVSLFALKELWDTGRLELGSYVWSEGMEKWEKVEDLSDLKAALHKVVM
jgi:apolipoprotein N-acyltransferase